MKRNAILITAALGIGAVITLAQDGGRRFGGPAGLRPMPPIVAALDTNKDGKLDTNEIANASTALKTLDKNGDGEITPEEMFGRPPAGGPRGFGGQPGQPPGNQQ